MTPQRHDQIMEIFLHASELRPAEREQFIVVSCAGDDEMGRTVEAMLIADEHSDQFLASPLEGLAANFVTSQEEPSVAVGQQLGDYLITALLDVGGMGEVYIADDIRLKRRAALKILARAYASDEAWLRRFEREAHAIAALNHPNIVTLYGLEEHAGVCFLATEFIEGKTVRELMVSQVSVATALDIAVQALSALSSAHASNIIHRDIKPENMILRPDGLLKVLDFGLAKQTDSSRIAKDAPVAEQTKSFPGLIVGTPRYMSPEQARGQDALPQSDLFSVGCVLYELLTGRAAASGENPSEILASILKEKPIPIGKLQPKCPKLMARVVERALEKDLALRYQTADEMLADLKKVRASAFASSAVRCYGRLAALGAGAVLIAAFLSLLSRHFPSMDVSTKSIAVLPFVNESGSDLDFLADGLTDSLIGDFAQVSGLKVMSRSSVFQFKHSTTDAASAGRMLRASSVLAGGISQQGDRILVRIELVDSRDGHRLWGQQFSRLRADLAQIQEDIPSEVLSKLRVTLDNEAERKMSQRHTTRTAAYEWYLKGHFLLMLPGDEANLNSAIDYFQRALGDDRRTRSRR